MEAFNPFKIILAFNPELDEYDIGICMCFMRQMTVDELFNMSSVFKKLENGSRVIEIKCKVQKELFEKCKDCLYKFKIKN